MESPATRPTHSLSTKVAIVTGAGSTGGIGNGRAIAILLAADGCKVVCVDRVYSLAHQTKETILAEGGEAIAVSADVTSSEDCEKAVQVAISTFERLDVLVNNVGVSGQKGTAEDFNEEEWNKVFNTNVLSMARMAKYCIPEMRKNDDSDGYRGSIVNMGSVAGLMGGGPSLLYSATKGAVVSMTMTMAKQHGDDGIRVNCVCPGMVYTPMACNRGMTNEIRETRRNMSLLKTEGNGWDIGAAVRFLVGGNARWITGQVLPVDAGLTAAIQMPRAASF
jgi:NAD(P)-dependent dehydrogenase (short-subunit alcohol dehydrogenase family)